MSGKLDQALDDIVSSTRQRGGARRTQRRSAGGPAAAAPIGGVRKTARPARNAAAKAPGARGPVPSGDSKVIVSNLVSSAWHPDEATSRDINCA